MTLDEIAEFIQRTDLACRESTWPNPPADNVACLVAIARWKELRLQTPPSHQEIRGFVEWLFRERRRHGSCWDDIAHHAGAWAQLIGVELPTAAELAALDSAR